MPKLKYKYIATSCEFMLHEDDWNEGEGKLISIWNEDVPRDDTVVGVLQHVPYLDKDYDETRCLFDIFEVDPIEEDDYSRFDGDLIVDIDNDEHIIKPTEEKWQKFQKGECKLYALHISVKIQKVADLDMSDVSQFID